MLSSLDVEHKLAKCSFETRYLPFENYEASARHSARGLEIHSAQAFAYVDVIPRIVNSARLTKSTLFHILVLISANWHVFCRQIGEHCEQLVKLIANRFKITPVAHIGVFERLNLFHQVCG